MQATTDTTRLTIEVEEIAQRLGTGERLVYEALRRGQLPGRKLGGRWIISRKRFDQWLNQEDAA